MFTRELLGLFPRKRVRAVDGMAVTAEVWQESHDYHRMLNRLYTLLLHGPGILAGLDVIASEPADNAVYIQPGVAVDSIGQPIIVPEPRAYDLGQAEGLLHLIVSYSESRPQAANGRVQEDAPLYVQTQYSLEAVSEPPPTPHIELARIWRPDATQPIGNAADPRYPHAQEIDLRYRRVIGAEKPPTVSVGVVYFSGAEDTGHAEGMANVAAAMRRSGAPLAGDLYTQATTMAMPAAAPQVWVDTAVRLDQGLLRYDLLYLVGRDTFDLTSDEMNSLYAYWQGGGVLFYESCRNGLEGGEPGADADFQDLLETFGVTLADFPEEHRLLQKPNLFAQLPVGYAEAAAPDLRLGENVLYSRVDYGCMWQGKHNGRPARREEIRAALEWGENLIHWAAEVRAAQDAG